MPADEKAIRQAVAISERADVAATPEERERRRKAGAARMKAMKETGQSYRDLVGGGLERRP